MRLIIIDGVTVAEIAGILGTRLEETKNTLPHASWYVGKRVQFDVGDKTLKGEVSAVVGKGTIAVIVDGEKMARSVYTSDVTVLQ